MHFVPQKKELCSERLHRIIRVDKREGLVYLHHVASAFEDVVAERLDVVVQGWYSQGLGDLGVVGDERLQIADSDGREEHVQVLFVDAAAEQALLDHCCLRVREEESDGREHLPNADC